MTTFVEGLLVPGGGLKVLVDNFSSAGARLLISKLAIGADGTLTFVTDVDGGRMPCKVVFSDSADQDVKAGNAALGAVNAAIVGGTSIVPLQLNNAVFNGGGNPAMGVWDDTSTDQLDEDDSGYLRCTKDHLLHTVGAPRSQVVRGSVTLTSTTTETTLIAAAAAGIFHDLTSLIVSNRHATTATVVEIRDDTGGSVIMTLDLPPLTPPTLLNFGRDPWTQTATAKNWTAKTPTGIDRVVVHAKAVKRVS